MRFIIFTFIFLVQMSCAQKVVIDKKISISKKVQETSGIVYLEEEKQIITFNDSGGKPELYVLDSKSGKLNRTVKVKNAQNQDWESITKDNNYLYIGDTGNNDGNRTNLVIYKVTLNQFLEKDEVIAEKIFFSYEDQTSFENNRHQTNFDCEAITICDRKLYLFTKNWGDYKTNVYTIPTEKGTFKAQKTHSFDINGMLTSIDYNPDNKLFVGTAYQRDYNPFLVLIHKSQLGKNQFKSKDLTGVLGLVNQTEAIAWKNKQQIYITREASKKKIDGEKYKRKQKLILLTLTN